MKYLKIYEDFDPFAHLKDVDFREDKKKTKDFVLGFTVGGNDKIKFPYFSLPAGYTCPRAGKCKTMVVDDPQTGRPKLMDYGQFRCYAGFDEVKYPNLRKRNWSNYQLILAQETKEDIVKLIERSFKFHFAFPPKYFRIHESGDFFNQKYFDSWLEVAKNNPQTVYYGFTTSLDYWVKRQNEMPNNFRLTASKGGKLDRLISEHNLRWCDVVANVEEAIESKLPIDIDDTLASSDSKEPFCILIHGGQKKGSIYTTDITRNKELIKQLKLRKQNPI